MVQKRKAEAFPSPSPSALFQSAAATEWLWYYWAARQEDTLPASVHANSSWISVFATPGSCVAQQSTASLMKVVASAEFGFLAWELEVRRRSDGGSHFVCMPRRSALAWRHITALADWAVVPTKPVLLHAELGPVGWEQSGPAMSLQANLCLRGLPITVQQMKDLIVLLGGAKPKGNASRKMLEEVLWQLSFLPEDVEQAKKSVTGASAMDEEDIDSQFSEVLSELGEDEANKTELKELTAIKKKARIKRQMDVPLQDEPVQKKKKGKGKGKGRGRGKVKREGTAAPVKRGLVDSLVRRARKRCKLQAGQGPPAESQKHLDFWVKSLSYYGY